jgi:tRNA(Ile)-lysidine synthase
MNADESFARVRVRRELVPLMKTFNPNVIEALTRTSDILREDNQSLEAAAARLLELSSSNGQTPISLQTDLLGMSNPALRRRALRIWLAGVRGDLRRLDRLHILAIEKLLQGAKSGRLVELPGGVRIVRSGGRLHYRKTGADK